MKNTLLPLYISNILHQIIHTHKKKTKKNNTIGGPLGRACLFAPSVGCLVRLAPPPRGVPSCPRPLRARFHSWRPAGAHSLIHLFGARFLLCAPKGASSQYGAASALGAPCGVRCAHGAPQGRNSCSASLRGRTFSFAPRRARDLSGAREGVSWPMAPSRGASLSSRP